MQQSGPRNAKGDAADVTGGITGWRRCHEDIDGPVMTGPYKGQTDAAEPDGESPGLGPLASG